ncbi:MATE family efflux transporter [Colwellia sp. BRX8-3]|jgi:MATE family multidrug resistance protein|nr:MATE family efflux transporter [Colwellia sp. BRX8-7]MBA6352385.1 MATE family efflux transporter [Colwellia sp. BRX9-1]MBA6355156.1 MATE family efflux transporter [Colwellia sp. BRX8-3]MBA6361206.1 MATE family efflux transporter [Colwellia sp. BRX8-6]MBA6363614.1 MATE family efflux transporter [Colwellia sp. BRX8-8]MBA6366302.1 MATE family efflux transporter [Colwellia sp. BRX8-5]MBA6369908.1 MATE family efflux transporter [Colwellia sp. BRX8-4]MBA6375257.1 MATE family efflux transporter 
MIFSNITIPLLGLVDTAVLGHLDQAYYLGGSTVGAMIITFVTWLCGFLRMSTTGLTAQALGEENAQKSLLVLLRGLLVACLIGGALILLQSFYLDLSLGLAGGSEQIQFYAKQYCDIRIWGLPAALSNLVILGWLLGNHKAKAVMWILIVTNLINLSLDLLFVLVFDWQVQGVASATLIAEYSGVIIGLAYIIFAQQTGNRQPLKSILIKMVGKFTAIRDQLFEKSALTNYFQLNRDILIRTLCLEICFVFITFQGARLGDDVIATNAILMNFVLLISFGLDGIANAAEVLVGKAQGQKNLKQRNFVVKIALFWTGLFALTYSALFAIAGDFLIGLLTDIPEVVFSTEQYVHWMIILPVLGCWCYLFDGVFVGLMKAKVMRNSMIIATFGCFFPMWWLLQGFGNHGLWAAFSVFLLVRGLSLAWHYYRVIEKQPISL